MTFIAVAAALAALNLVAANPCPVELPEIIPIVVQSVLPAPAIFGPAPPAVLEHESAPYEIIYFEKPWIVKHKQSAALSVYTQKPVVVDEFAAPAFNEAPAEPAVIVEEVCPE